MAIGAATVQASQEDGATGALPCPSSASVAHLNVKGTATVASLARNSSTVAASTRSLRSRRSDGQMYGHRCMSVRGSVALPTVRSEERRVGKEGRGRRGEEAGG